MSLTEPANGLPIYHCLSLVQSPSEPVHGFAFIPSNAALSLIFRAVGYSYVPFSHQPENTHSFPRR